jgi:hypothetical protein
MVTNWIAAALFAIVVFVSPAPAEERSDCGTGLRLERFRMIWPWRNEVVSGGAIVTGKDPNQEPRTEGITKVGADPDEGVPYKAPAPEPREHGIPRHCLTS